MQPGSQQEYEAWAMSRHMRSGLGWRSAVSIVVVFGWLVFVLLFFAFWAYRFTLFQNVMIFFASIVAGIGVLGAMWASYGLRFAR